MIVVFALFMLDLAVHQSYGYWVLVPIAAELAAFLLVLNHYFQGY